MATCSYHAALFLNIQKHSAFIDMQLFVLRIFNWSRNNSTCFQLLPVKNEIIPTQLHRIVDFHYFSVLYLIYNPSIICWRNNCISGDRNRFYSGSDRILCLHFKTRFDFLEFLLFFHDDSVGLFFLFDGVFRIQFNNLSNHFFDRSCRLPDHWPTTDDRQKQF